MKRQSILVLAMVVVVLWAGPVFAELTEGLIASEEQDWPQWRGQRRDGISDEEGLLLTWPASGPKLLWKVDGLGTGWSSPIVVGERLYVTGDVGDDLIVFAFDRSGTPQWRAKNGKAWEGPYPGARACCAFSEGRLYHLNAHGRLACLDAGSGKELWAVDILKRFSARNITWALSECLLVDGTRVIVTPGGKKALMAALDKRNGQTVWTTEPLGEDHTSHCSPILFRYAGRRVIANCSSAHGFGVDADTGKLLWTVPLKNPHGVNTTTPVYGSGRVFYVTPYAELGRSYRLGADGQGITAEHLWTSPLDTVTGGAVLVDGALFAAGYKNSKWWFGVDWQTGKTKYELTDLTTGAAIYADGRLYCLDESGTVALLKPGSESLDVVSRFRLVTRRVRDAWAHPVLHDGRLYLRYHETLWCYDVKER
ncbi:MAG: PQQ-binding-like beta-propeller repeat protein [Phycisphaerae bacterium]